MAGCLFDSYVNVGDSETFKTFSHIDIGVTLLYDEEGLMIEVITMPVFRMRELKGGTYFMSSRKRSPWRAMMLVSVISSYVIGGVLGGVFLGLWLGDRFGAKPFFLIISLLAGLVTCFYSIFKTIQPFLGDDDEK